MYRSSLTAIVLVGCSSSASAGVVAYTNKAAWQAAVGSYTTIDFTGYQDGYLVTDQYAHLGITFAGAQHSFGHAGAFLNDGEGLRGAPNVHIHFSEPQDWIAVDFPGTVRFRLYRHSELIHTSELFFDFISYFAGLVSAAPFDEVIIDAPLPGIPAMGIDDLYFGPPIPAPGALGAFALAALLGRRRRRRGRLR
jgi:MYXO-CTERM domain-containing protein